MAAGNHQQTDHGIFREGFEITCWNFGGFAVVKARPYHSREPGDDALPALPSRSRIVVWGSGSGQIRDHVRKPTVHARFAAWLRGLQFPSREAQLEALTDELLAAIGEAPGGTDWAERGGDTQVPRWPIRLPGQRPIDLEPAPMRWATALVALGLAAARALARAAGRTQVRGSDPNDGSELPPEPVQISESDETGSPPGTADPAGDAGGEAGGLSSALATTEAASATNVVIEPSEASVAEPSNHPLRPPL